MQEILRVRTQNPLPQVRDQVIGRQTRMEWRHWTGDGPMTDLQADLLTEAQRHCPLREPTEKGNLGVTLLQNMESWTPIMNKMNQLEYQLGKRIGGASKQVVVQSCSQTSLKEEKSQKMTYVSATAGGLSRRNQGCSRRLTSNHTSGLMTSSPPG